MIYALKRSRALAIIDSVFMRYDVKIIVNVINNMYNIIQSRISYDDCIYIHVYIHIMSRTCIM